MTYGRKTVNAKKDDMGIAERKAREKDERRNLIMNCTKDLILELGAESVRMSDIAKRAELSKATLYFYYKTKDELLKEICDTLAEKLNKYFYSSLPSDLRAIDAIKFYWSCYIKTLGYSDDILVIFSMRKYLTPDLSFARFNLQTEPNSSTHIFYATLKDLIERGIKEGDFDPVINSETLVRTFIMVFSCIVEDASRMPKGSEKSKYIIEQMQSIFTIILRGILRTDIDSSVFFVPGMEAGAVPAILN
jgi:AcrR family transcriptional regulator